MKKNIFFVLMAVASVGFADVSVSWFASAGVLEHAGTQDSYLGYAQLIWSSENPFDHVANYAFNDGLDSSGTEFLLETYSVEYNWLQSDADAAVFTDENVGGSDINAGYLFIRLFDTSSVVDGSYYYQSSVTSPDLAEYTYGDTSAIYQLDAASGDSPVVANVPAIPEPATMLIFGPGIAGLLGYRRRKDSLRGQLRALFERRQACIKARKAKVGTERELVDPLTSLNKLFVKREHKRFDLLGDLLMAIDARFSK